MLHTYFLFQKVENKNTLDMTIVFDRYDNKYLNNEKLVIYLNNEKLLICLNNEKVVIYLNNEKLVIYFRLYQIEQNPLVFMVHINI